MRRLTRFSWLRVLITLAICLLASPGTVRAPLLVVHAASAKSTSAYVAPAKRDFTQDEVLISYCTSCGFQQNFAQVKEYLEDKYPHLIDRVTGVKEAVDPMKSVRGASSACRSGSLLGSRSFCGALAAGYRLGLRAARGHGAHGRWRIRECTVAG